MQTRERGFTLVEILVASAVLVIFMVGMLNLLDTSTKVAQLETSLADTQENVRFAAYHIMRTARMMGGASMPFAGQSGGADTWISGMLISNANGVVDIDGFGGVNVLQDSDVLTLRGFFEVSPFFTNPGEAVVNSTTVAVSEYNANNEQINDFSTVSLSGLEGRGIVFMGRGQYCVGRLNAGASFQQEGFDRKLHLIHMQGEEPWPNLNTTWSYPPAFDVYRVGILESYTYFVSPDNVLRRVRLSGGSPQAEPVAINIGGIQFALGVDTNDDGQVDMWNVSPAGAGSLINDEVISLRITVLGRTDVEVEGYRVDDEMLEVEDGTSGIDTKNKWRRIQVAVNLRNYKS
jgi:prepilin-type N-terminal cleavage/methylation domain-containing protein